MIKVKFTGVSVNKKHVRKGTSNSSSNVDTEMLEHTNK